jgi:hypothetical protein
MIGEAPIGCLDQSDVKPGLPLPGFVAGAQQNCASFRIERIGCPPYASCCGPTKFFHVAEGWSFQSVRVRSFEMGAELGKKT